MTKQTCDNWQIEIVLNQFPLYLLRFDKIYCMYILYMCIYIYIYIYIYNTLALLLYMLNYCYYHYICYVFPSNTNIQSLFIKQERDKFLRKQL